jgi:NodT family efflux transporter outer membrane factor (OMF) lipoprotein
MGGHSLSGCPFLPSCFILRTNAAFLVLLPALFGCASPREWWNNGFKVGPNYCATKATVADSWIEASDPRLCSTAQANACWWAAFGDSTLNQLVSEAAQQNLSLKMAGCRILEARAQRGVAEGNLFPQQQSMSAEYTRSQMSQHTYPFNIVTLPSYSYDFWGAGFNAAWELDFWGRFRRAVEAADANLNAQVEGYDNVLVLLQAEVATNYIQMRAFEERIALARKNVELQRESLRIITLRAQRGLVTELDVQQAITNLGTTEALIPTLIMGHRAAQNRLCILMGQPPYVLAQRVGSPGTIPAPPREVIVGIPAELLRRRPDVRQAEREAAAQSARIGIAEADFYPHIAITGSIGLQAQKLNQLFESSSVAGAIGPGISWNILNYGRIVNNVRAEDARFQEAVLGYRDTVLRANEEVENGIISFLNEQDRVKSLEKSTGAAARSVELAFLQYQKGLISYQPLLDSQRELVQQEDALAQSRGMVGVDLVAVYKALGGGWAARLAEQQPPAAQVIPPGPETPLP